MTVCIDGGTLYVPGDVDENDNSTNEAVGTLGAEAVQQAVISKFGGGAIEFTPTATVDPSTAFLSFPDSANYSLGGNPFTIQMWARFKDLTVLKQTFASHYLNTGDNRGWFIQRTSGNLAFLFYQSDGATIAVNIQGAVSWAIDTWYHILVSRDASDDFRMFVDGVQIATANDTNAMKNVATSLWLGKARSAGADDFPLDGFIDDFHFDNGTARQTANFTPPQRAFNNPLFCEGPVQSRRPRHRMLLNKPMSAQPRLFRRRG